MPRRGKSMQPLVAEWTGSPRDAELPRMVPVAKGVPSPNLVNPRSGSFQCLHPETSKTSCAFSTGPTSKNLALGGFTALGWTP